MHRIRKIFAGELDSKRNIFEYHDIDYFPDDKYIDRCVTCGQCFEIGDVGCFGDMLHDENPISQIGFDSNLSFLEFLKHIGCVVFECVIYGDL